MDAHDPVDDSLVISYLALRRAVGIVGTALPFVLAFGAMLLRGDGLQSSISSYYYTVMGDVFVGSLCVIGVFLMSYRGYERKDDVAGHFACVFAVGVALFPTTPEFEPSATAVQIGRLHLLFAACLFLTLAFFCLALFRKTDPASTPTRRKLHRNKVYTTCGYTILACIGLIAAVSFVSDDSPVKSLDPVFWLEAAAIVAFGVSWLTKGEAILADT